MSLRFLVTGDTQCGNFSQFNYVRKDGMGSRLYNTLVFNFLLKQCEKLRINKALINGDVFEDCGVIETEVYDAVYCGIERLHSHGIDTAINIGNHDISRVFDNGVLHALRPFRKVAQVIEKPRLVWGCLWVVPWMQNIEKLKKAILDGVGKAECLVLHCGVQGARTGPNSILVKNALQLDDVKPKSFRLVLLSDYHTQQYLRKNVFYLGSPLQHSFGEVHRPAIWSIKLNESGFSAEPIYTNLPRFRRVDYSNAQQMFEKHEGDYFRVHVPIGKRVHEEELEQLAKTYHCQIQLVHEAGQKASEALPETVEMAEAVRAYAYSQVQGKKARRRLLGAGRALLARKPCFGAEKG